MKLNGKNLETVIREWMSIKVEFVQNLSQKNIDTKHITILRYLQNITCQLC